MPERPEPAMATPSAHATRRTATPLSTAPPTASTARNGCHWMVSRSRPPPYWNSACPSVAHRITMKRAPSDTSTLGLASPRAMGASHTPVSPPRISPAVAAAPVTKPCQ